MNNKNNILNAIVKSIEVDSVIRKYNDLKIGRDAWNQKWQMIQNHVFPNMRNYVSPKAGMISPSQTSYRSFTSAVCGKVSKIVSQISSQLCDPSVKWLDIKFVDPIVLSDGSMMSLSENSAAKRWLALAVERTYAEFANPCSNFYPSTYEFLFDWYTIGTACREIILRKDNGRIHFNTISMQNIFVDTNGYGDIENIYRIFTLNVRQAYDLFGENISENDKRELATKKESKKAKEYVEVTMKNPMLNHGLPTLPYVSCVIDKSAKQIVNLELHREKPYVISRFFTSPGEIYGRSFVWDAMPDIIALNKISKRILQAYDYALSPPLLVKDITSIANFQMSPNSYVQGLDEGGRATIQPLNIGANLPFSIEYYNSKMADLDEALLSRDIFEPANSNMTATEVNERKLQYSNRIRPILVRLEHEDLNNTVTKTFSLLAETGAISPFPFEEAGVLQEQMPDPFSQIKISFSGKMAKMQRMQDVANNDMLFNKVMSAAQVDQSVLDRFNLDEMIKQDADILGVSPRVMNDDQTVQTMREQRNREIAEKSARESETMNIENMVKLKGAGIEIGQEQ